MKNENRLEQIRKKAAKKIEAAFKLAEEGNQTEVVIKILPAGKTCFVNTNLSEKVSLEQNS